ncbi:competence protein ComGF [Helicobacter sp. 13S00482-2]|uniref:HD domain-containing protein n=1 Tax=Helicobacter sp. 13S00482-2 TaxID=1476200 RepID=UPI000BA6AE98|nr:HD domain-containing protein [Helicobacter sp. 13S00482-2]PAF53712.1 competence protein ComGF [Helicobacter sp. 13S00482-2]
MQSSKPRLKSKLLRRLFVAASIRRWNDQACPVEFVELDKQAHKMVISYLLARYEEQERGICIDWEKLIEYFCFEFFARVVLTDIKPPVFHQLQKHHQAELARYVMAELQEELGEYDFFPQMEQYLATSTSSIEIEILRAAHFYASKWEFDIIYNFNPHMYDMRNIKKIIDDEVEEYYHLRGIQKIVMFEKVRELVTMFGQLRFQKRWSQTPRVPATSVLGHTLIVAISAYLLSLDIKTCKQMRINHFLGGLFHDLPEILTRDIISPIKRNVMGLDEHIKKIEEEAVKSKILSIVPHNIAEDIVYFTQNEFSNRYKVECFTKFVKDGKDLMQNYNQDEYSPVYGEFLKICDNLSAFLEAKISISHGISSSELTEGAKSIFEKCSGHIINDVDIGSIFRDFE